MSYHYDNYGTANLKSATEQKHAQDASMRASQLQSQCGAIGNACATAEEYPCNLAAQCALNTRNAYLVNARLAVIRERLFGEGESRGNNETKPSLYVLHVSVEDTHRELMLAIEQLDSIIGRL